MNDRIYAPGDEPENTVYAPAPPPANMVYIQFYLPVEQKEKLRRIAEQRQITLSEAIRRALNPYLSKVK